MFNIKEFYKARKRLFENQNNIHTLSDLENYLSDLDLVCANERSSEIADLLLPLLELAKPFNNNQALFELNWQYFQQTYYYVKNLDKTIATTTTMKELAKNINNVKNSSRIYQAESLVLQIQGDIEEANKLMRQAYLVIQHHEHAHPEEYYRALYSYTHFSFSKDGNLLDDSIQNMERCLSHYSKSHSMRGLIAVIHNLLVFYLYLGTEKSIDDLIKWVLSNNQIQNNLLSNLSISLNLHIGMSYSIRNQLEQATYYLLKAHSEIEKQKLQKEMMYEYTVILKFLSRSHAYLGNFNQSYDLLVELATFMEDPYVALNFFERGKKIFSISSYYTLLFIFVQLDLNIESIKDEKLKRIHEYIQASMSQSQVSKELLLDSSDNKIESDLIENKERTDTDEISIVLYQLLLTHRPYKSPEKNAKVIEKIRLFAFEPLYADILLGKILISMGNYEKFKEITIKLKEGTTDTKAPILKIWRDFFVLLNEYIENPDKNEVVTELEKLILHCKESNFIKMSEEIQMYHRLISSTRTISQFSQKVKQTVFLDIYDNQSKKMVLEYLEKKQL